MAITPVFGAIGRCCRSIRPFLLSSPTQTMCQRPASRLTRSIVTASLAGCPAARRPLSDDLRRWLSAPQIRHCSSAHHMCQNATAERNVLPTNVVPKHYAVHLTPDMEAFTFTGKEVIDIEIVESTNTIVLNAVEIDVKSAQVGSAKASEISYDKEEGRVTLSFTDALATGVAKLEIVFDGIVNDSMAGFYRSSYINKKTGKQAFLGTTQMEATDCRKAFPCWDEPLLKATFGITLTTDEQSTVLSNMDVKEENVENGKKTTVFNNTPKMSTYLVAWVIGDLEYIETFTPGEHMAKIPVRVYSTPGLAHQGQFSLDLAAKTLEFYSKTFDIAYPLPKMDMVAIPDFAAGAMENWGLVTYRVVDLLFDPKTSGANVQERVAEVVQHELAHQWFGNLTTMQWWDGLWLNEGFATWMSWYSAHHFFPGWNVWDKFVTDTMQGALRLDGLRSSHPIEVPVKSAEEINQIFDAISYSKGSCVIRMVSQFLGEEVFMAGIRRYLKKHAYGNTVTEDLWEALSQESGKDVTKIAAVWTKKIGYPVVFATESDGEIQLKQNRFLTTADVKAEEDETLYCIPLALQTIDAEGNVKVDSEARLDSRESTIKIGSGNTYKLNTGHSGIYRTNYTPEHLAKLGSLGQKSLAPADRAGLVADAGALSTSGYAKTSGLLSLIESWKDEKAFVVWSEIIARLSAIDAAWAFEDEKILDAFQNYKRKLVAPQAHKAGYKFSSDPDAFVENQLKSLLFAAAASAKDPETVRVSQGMFEAFVAGDRDAIDPNLRATVFSTAIKNGGVKEYDFLSEVAKDHSYPPEIKLTALRSLGCSKDPKLIARTLSLMETKDIKDQDVVYIFVPLRGHKAGIEAMWEYLRNNYAAVDKRLPNSVGSLKSSVIISMTSGFTQAKAVSDIKEFFKDKDTKAFNKGLEQVCDSILAKAGWLERDAKDVEQFLQKYL
ncbi:aminopeptidase Ape2 [Protomyces lactucae-debilis]|uniref:Aminopeptidase n=1 Tax=Protomyces lactucae-debilis TaxID=2754530 RepID=A0A1Y2FSI2_PROLT|nr:aminopeptidase Ape2 [Protomyces lactucae-debilis]ORY86962.1 aminopeptidase Ape2 [Protomyces lactucae-debilis]